MLVQTLPLVLSAIVVGVRVNGILVRTGDATPVVRGQELVHRVVGGVLVLGVRDHVPVFEFVVTVVVVVVAVPRGVRFAPSLQERIILRCVLAVEVIVLGLGRGLVYLVLSAIVVGVRVNGVLVRTGDATPVVRGQELVHRVVGGVFVLGVRDHVPVLELVVTVVVVVVAVPRGVRLAFRLHCLQGIELIF